VQCEKILFKAVMGTKSTWPRITAIATLKKGSAS